MRRSFLSLPLVLVLSMFLVPYESLAQGCLGAGGGGLTGGVISSQNGQPCANIDALNLSAVYGAAIRVTVGNVQAGDNVTARINWNDGTGFTASFPLVNLGGGTWEVVSPRHFFPVLATACEYIPITEMSINGAVCSANWGTPPVFFRWNQEGVANAPSSVFDVTETATSVTIFEVCAGVSTNVTFTDRSNMNCNTNPGDVTIAANLNNRRRWRQFVYGGAGALNTITGGVTVTATPVPNGTAYTGPVISYLPLSSGAPLGTGGGPDVPLNQSVAGWLIPPTATVTETITVPATAVAGEEFVITTRYWNACNRYDLAGSAPVEYNATRIRVVGKPAAPNAVTAAAVCNGTTRSGMATFAISGAPGSATIRWYANTTGASPAVPGTVGALITTTTASGGGNSNIPFSTAFPGAAGTVMPAENYIVWATYLGASGSALCESQPRAVTRSVRELLDTPLSGTSLQAYTGGTGTV
ncbi:MAG: hypothetical protein JNK10_10995, partial [Cyclobacteriaceae bacterium]|nr:hypothetical protein [Cyclobacteriaceae bacterium]